MVDFLAIDKSNLIRTLYQVLNNKNQYVKSKVRFREDPHRFPPSDQNTQFNIDAHPADFFSDGIHPSPLTYQTWAKDMARFILDQNIAKSFLKGSSIDKT